MITKVDVIFFFVFFLGSSICMDLPLNPSEPLSEVSWYNSNFDLHIILFLLYFTWTGKNVKEQKGSTSSCSRVWVVPHLSSGIVERAKHELAWKSPHARQSDMPRVSPFSRRVIVMRPRVSLAPLSMRKHGGLLLVYLVETQICVCRTNS